MAQAAAATGKAHESRLSRATLMWQALSSFVVVVVCYWVYWFVAVPLIEPNVEDRATASATQDEIETARGDVNARQRAVAQYFAPGDWEMDHPAVSQIGQMRLLFKSLTAMPDGTVALRPCTLMFFPKDDAGSARQRPVIMRAVEGADIRFDEPIVLKSVDLSKRKFVGGRLIGEIRINRQESAPGAGDDLEITTREVEMLGQRAWTPEPVKFRFGRSYGSGRDLEILLGAKKDAPQTSGVMRGASFRTLRLKRDVRMRLEMGGPAPAAAAPQPQSPDEPPIEITCQGRFEFEIEEYAASFHDQVDVFRLNPEGESDQLNCQLLSVYFAKPGAAAPEPKSAEQDASGVGASQVRMIEARGNPVTMRSPAQGMYARCKGVDYIPGAPGTPGSLAAFGPGVIHGNLPNDPAGKYVAQWARQLRFEPDGPMQRATLRGATMVKIGQMGTITADEVYAWLSQKPRPPRVPVAQVGLHAAANQPAAGINADAWQIERVLARRYPDPAAQSQGNVVIDSPQLHAVSATLEATIERGQAIAQEAAPGQPANPQAPPRPAQPAPQNPSDRFEVAGASVHIQLVPQGEELAVAGATIERGAQLEQFAIVGGKQQRSLLVKGDQLRVSDAHTPDTKVTIVGNPGYVEAGGMTLWGGAIELEKRTNHLWINGPGRLTMPIAQDLDGQPLAREQALAIDWQKRMDFQSQTAVFEGLVVARSEQQVLNTEKLEAVLTRAVEFGNPNAAVGGNKDGRPELAQVRSHGPTFLEGRQMDEHGAQTSFSRMELFDLSIDRSSGAIAGRGPGWVTHVTRGTGPQILGPAQAPNAPRVQPPADKPYTYLHVTFQKGIGGNINRRAVKFFDRTRTVYGPVADWNVRLDGNDLAALGPQGMTLDASELEVREMNRRGGGKRGYFELDASGGVSAEGQRFTAVGDRLTYAEQQDQLILRGSPAEMFLENESGGQRHETRANEVRYWFTQHNVQVSGAQHLNIALPPESQKKLRDELQPQAPAAPPR